MKRIFFLCILLSLVGCTKQSAPAPDSVPSGVSSPAGAQTQKSLPKIVAFGDSLTAGLGLSTNEAYPALLQELLKRDGYDYEVVNSGVSGDTSAGGVRRIDWALDGDVRFLILELGANDFLRGQPIAQTKQNLAEIIDRSQRKNAKVLLAGMLAPTNAGREYQAQIRNMFVDLAREKNVTLIPFFLESVAGLEGLNQPDGIHPNAAGTKLVAETVYKHLKPMLENDRRQKAGGRKQEAGGRRRVAGGRRQEAESRKQKADFPFFICQSRIQFRSATTVVLRPRGARCL